ncbi:MAG: Holliday junction resolvase RuvX [Ruminococcus sp.]|nr:Holliday junction resolvase RuvX [Ruminococcus sp.]
MRYLGLDLGTKTLGVAITDRTGTITRFLKVIRFKNEDYDMAAEEVIKIVNEYNISKIALGLPKNMNNSLGYASSRSLDFKKLLESKIDIPIHLIDERLSTVEAENMLIDADVSRNKRKKVIDGIAAEIILDTFLKMEEKHE